MRLQAALKLGELLTAQKELMLHGEWIPWIESNFPFGRKRAADFMKVHRHRDQMSSATTFEEALDMVEQTHVSHNAGENEWHTPPEYLEAARKVLGSIASATRLSCLSRK